MKKFILRRVFALIPVLFFVSVIVFTLIHLTPGDPARVMLGDKAPESNVRALRKSLGLDDPLPVQYFKWMGRIGRGNFGRSVFMQERMGFIIGSHLAPTLTLTAYALGFAVLISVPLGIFAARRRSEAPDLLVEGLSMAGISIPSFLLGLFLILLFSVRLGWLPAAGYKTIRQDGFFANLRYMVLPAAALGSMQAGLLIRMTRSSILEALNSDYIRMITAKGMSGRTVVVKHALRNALFPILTTIGQTLMTLLSGAAVVESVFNIPGIGKLIINSVARRDYEVIQAVVLVTALINILVCLGIDLLYGLADPRVRLGKD
jgi:peptide/nickel transport system permease protein